MGKLAHDMGKDFADCTCNAEIERLKQDKKRLDWLVPLVSVDFEHKHRGCIYYRLSIKATRGNMALREAIDAAMREGE